MRCGSGRVNFGRTARIARRRRRASDKLMKVVDRKHGLPAVTALAIVVALGGEARAQDVQSLVKRAVQVQLNADDTDHSCWVFHEVDRKPNDSVVQWVAQTHSGAVIRVTEKNGHPVS